MNATVRVVSLHHVTATVDTAQADLDFYAGLLGMRLVKRTVNFDNRGVYHFYYGDELGHPGTIWTTFPYHGMGVRRGVHGAGQVTATALSIPKGTLGYWSDRLRAAGVEPVAIPPRFGEAAVSVTDPSGLTIELVEADDGRPGWAGGGVDSASGIRGLRSVTLTVREADPTVRFLLERLGLSLVGGEGRSTRLAAGIDGPGHTIDVHASAEAEPAVNGIGTVHHVALATPDAETQLAIREDVLALGIDVTPVRDRQYFQSIYFREPGGVLIEIATVRPGFTVDESVETLGQALKLPPWEEPHRGAIAAGLPTIVVP